MAEKPFTGLTAKIELGTDVLGYIEGCTLNLSKDIIEILGFGMEYKEKVPAIKDWNLSINGTAAFGPDSAQNDLLDAFESGDGITVTVYLDDNTKFEGTGYIESIDIEAAPDDKISITAEVAGSGAVTTTIPTT